MDYAEQRKFLRSSRTWGAGLVLVLFAAVVACIQTGKISDPKLLALYAALAAALAVFIYYTPDYLHLSVDSRQACALGREDSVENHCRSLDHQRTSGVE